MFSTLFNASGYSTTAPKLPATAPAPSASRSRAAFGRAEYSATALEENRKALLGRPPMPRCSQRIAAEPSMGRIFERESNTVTQ